MVSRPWYWPVQIHVLKLFLEARVSKARFSRRDIQFEHRKGFEVELLPEPFALVMNGENTARKADGPSELD